MLRAILLLVGGAALISAIVVGMWRRSRRVVHTQPVPPFTDTEVRQRLLKDLPVTERRLEFAGVSTSLLEGGEGPPLVLLHGQGNFAAAWMPVIPDLVRTYHVIAPDLPGLGASEALEGPPGATTVLQWLGELIDQTCETPPAVVGISLGGQVATRFAARHSEQIVRLVIVDTPGLVGRVRPAPGALLALIRHSARPSERSALRLLRYATFDLERVRQQLGERWEPFVEYMVDRARTPSVRKANRRLMREVGLQQIPPEDLARISVPTTLIWGRHDRVAPLRSAEEASARYGWPLQVIEDAGHISLGEQPEAFLDALHAALSTSSEDSIGQ
jgi:pimeloyl-ACP methyl ester carboxylesterase